MLTEGDSSHHISNTTHYCITPRQAPPCTIRAMTHFDVPDVHALHRECFPVEYTAAFIASLVDRKKGVALVGVSAEGNIIGVASGWAVKSAAYICTVGVTSSFRRQGIASSLLESIIRIFEDRGSTSVFLHMKVGNDAALAFYKRLGFSVECPLPQHYSIGGMTYDGLQIRRALNPPTSFLWSLFTCDYLVDCFRRLIGYPRKKVK